MTIREPMRSALLLFVGAVFGFFAGDIYNFRSDNRAVLDREFSEVQRNVDHVGKDLRLLSDQAHGRLKLSAAQIRKFEDNIYRLRQSASDVRQILPITETEFNSFSNAIVKLQSATRNMSEYKTPDPYLDIMAHFLETQKRFIVKVQAAQRSYIQP